MAEAHTMKPVRFYPSSIPEEPFAGFMFVNYEIELRAVLSAIASCAKNRSQAGIVAFGYPGNGKRAFAKRVSNALWEYGFDVLWIDIAGLIASVGERLESAIRVVKATADRPLLIVIEELDSVENGLRDNPNVKQARELLLTAAGSSRAVMILATAVNPEDTKSEMRYFPNARAQFVYFGWPDPKRAEHFFEALKIPSHQEVARRVFEVAAEKGVSFTGSSLIGGARQVQRIVGDLAKLSPTEIAGGIASFCSPTPRLQADRYEDSVAEHIDESQRDVVSMGAAVEDWHAILEEIRPQRLSA